MSLDHEIDAAFNSRGRATSAFRRESQLDNAETTDLVSSSSPKEKNEKQDRGLKLTSLKALLEEPIEETRWLVQDLLPQGGLSILAGKPKAGKSTFARSIGLAIARGSPVMGRSSVAGPVIYIGLEDKRSEIAGHFRAMGAMSEPLLVHTGPAPRAGLAVWQLLRLIQQHQAVLAVIDTMLRFVQIRDIADYSQATEALDPLVQITRHTGCHIMAVYHAPKMDREGLDAILGSVAIAGSCDTGLILKRKTDGTRTLSATQRYGSDMPDTVVELDSETRIVGAGGTVADRERRDVEAAILAVLRQGSAKEKEIRVAVGGNTGLVGAALRALFGSGLLDRSGNGVSGDPYVYRLPGSAGLGVPE